MNKNVLGRISHKWKRNSNFVYDTYPPMYDFICTNCQKQISATKPPLEECDVAIQRGRNERMF